MQFFRSSSRRRSSKASSSGSSVRQSYVEPSESLMRDAATKSCLWPCDEFMEGAGIKEEFDQFIHNIGLAPFIADKCPQHLELTKTFTKKFKYFPHESRVSFNLYDHPFTMPLDVFCEACKIPYWGSLDEPPKPEYESFLINLCYS